MQKFAGELVFELKCDSSGSAHLDGISDFRLMDFHFISLIFLATFDFPFRLLLSVLFLKSIASQEEVWLHFLSPFLLLSRHRSSSVCCLGLSSFDWPSTYVIFYTSEFERHSI